MKKTICFLVIAVPIILLSPLGFASGIAKGDAATVGYIKIGDIKGEATGSGHRGWLDVVNWKHQKAEPNKRLEMMKVTVRKDKAAPALTAAFRDKKVFSNATLEDISTPGEYIKIEMIDVIVTSCVTNAATVDLVLNFEEIKWTYK